MTDYSAVWQISPLWQRFVRMAYNIRPAKNAIDKNPYSDYTPYKSEYGFICGRSSYIFA